MFIHCREPLTTKEQEAPLPDYTVMVQEAIYGKKHADSLINKSLFLKSWFSLTALTTSGQGCSLLGIFLYILNQYPMTEPVELMNLKIRSTLAMLKVCEITIDFMRPIPKGTHQVSKILLLQPKLPQRYNKGSKRSLEVIEGPQRSLNVPEGT